MVLLKGQLWILGFIFLTSTKYVMGDVPECSNNATVAVHCRFDEGNTCVDDPHPMHYVCVCNNLGYMNDTDSVEGYSICKERDCSNSNETPTDLLKRICGVNTKTCTGKILQRECNCNTDSYRSKNGQYCFFAPCQASPTIQQNCGPGNQCYGNAPNYICDCSARGYKRSAADNRHCELKSDEELTPIEEYCGKGSLYANGTINNITCTCDTDKGFFPSATGETCISPSCYLNPQMQEKCGPENTCLGGKDDYVCLCSNPNYKRNATDLQHCIRRTCADTSPAIDFKSICGEGATGCSGYVDKPLCSCDVSNHYVPAADGRSCIRATCKGNKKALEQCGQANSCTGSFDNFLCVCDANGYYLNTTNNTCVERECTDPDLVITDICGVGSLSCNGKAGSPECICDKDKFYYASEDLRSCVKANCLSSETISKKCGKENSCYGSMESYVCNCNAPGYLLNTTDNQGCYLGMCEDNGLEYDKVCGEGAISCNGTIKNLECNCGMNYVQSPDKKSCIRADCRANQTMHEQCGEDNDCVGSLEDWMCICSTYGYKPDPMDMMKCKKVMCEEEVVNNVTVCGLGTTGCKGHILKPECTCDIAADYVPSEDASRCIKGSCENNKMAMKDCGIANSCTGSYNNYVCVCNGFGYKKLDDTHCVEQMCSDPDIDIRNVCGEGAHYCNGTVNQRVCSCNETEYFYPSADSKSCVKATCAVSPMVMEQCGVENSCQGSQESFICNCNALGYLLNTTTNQHCYLGTCENGDFDLMQACGDGALYCNGTIKNLECQCDESKGYVQAPDKMSCIPNDCRGNLTMYRQCGQLNKCVGSIDSWRCICDSPYYVAHSDIMKCKLLHCSDSEVDHVEVCGKGTIGCSGSTLHPTCHCNTTENYFASKDGMRCVAGSCKTNQTAVKQCGDANSCAGSHSEWTCICDGIGYKHDPADPQNCLLKTCNDADIDIVATCGVGAISCEGYQLMPKCECNDRDYYIPSDDRTSCELASCRANRTAMRACGEMNDCRGSFSSHICLCHDPAYKSDPSDSQVCLEKTCEAGDFELVRVCGKGATGCSGSMKNIMCECDNAKGYVASADHTQCIPSDCNNNVTMHLQCGEGNGCVGSLTDWYCVCSAPGYEPHASDHMKCHLKTCADPGVDHVQICGMGATSCMGPVINPVCYCNESMYYIPSMDRTSCIKASCMSNKTAIAQCGSENSCSGSPDNFVCLCQAYGYRQDTNNNQACIPSQCEDAGIDFVEICGQGGVGCSGSVLNPVCMCDHMKHFVPSPDQNSCVLSTCRGNETAMTSCGEQNKCFGSSSSYICVCDAVGYKPHPTNLQECVLQTCEANELNPVAVCGKGALSCKGTIQSLMCECDNSKGYVAAPGYKSCIPADCRANMTMHAQCGTGNRCRGSMEDWSCVCDGIGSKPHPTDHMSCIAIDCSDTNVDIKSVCGYGATGCMGLARDPICHCDTSKYYVQSEDGRTCVPATCHTNKTAQMQCGPDNSCIGPPNDFICECTGFGYRHHETDKQKCVPIQCNETALFDIERVCGKGATGCRGNIRQPICDCDHAMYFHPSEDRRTCIEASCRRNSSIRADCGVENTCFGSTRSWICDCNSYGSILNPSDVKKCMLATCEAGQLDAVAVCGKGALSCKGSMRDVQCTCNNELGYVHSPDGKKCLPSDCSGNVTMHHQCGDANKCMGSLTDWVCICDAPGYKPHATDKMKCHQISCADNNVDPVDVCGIGATSCKGPITNPLCQCDTDNYYITSSDGASCIPATCKTNKTAIHQCGEANSCEGPADNFICVCNAYGYKLDDNDHQRCVEISCDDPNAHESICGTGSTGCRGTARDPICECDHTQHFVASSDLTSCLLASCRANDTVMNHCGDGNTCFGSLTSHICVCEAFGYKLNPNNHKHCLEETCEDDMLNPVAVCGKGAVSCSGPLKSVKCECDNNAGFFRSPGGMKCESTSCRQNPASQMMCGSQNQCYGSYDDWYCDCSAPGYMANQTNAAECLKVMCDDMAVDVCGLGATGCTGHTLNPICTCDSSMGYMMAKDKHSCVPMDCSMNPASSQCGYGNTCHGSYFSYVCVCSTAGTVMNKTNPMECINVACPADAVHVCGEGATNCSVTSTNNVECSCEEGYHPADDLHSCVLDDCRFNPKALKACGLLNKCVGSYKSWKCNCHYPEFTQDPWDHQTCVVGPCMVEQCGKGNAPGSFQHYAVNCSGLYDDPICNCQPEYTNDAKGGCIPKICSENPVAVQACGSGYCEGTYFKYTCKCDEPAFVQTPDKMQCVPAKCNIQQCGHGFDRGLYIDFAESCSGTYADPMCQCKTGFSGTNTSKCGPAIDGCKLDKCDPLATCQTLDVDGNVKCTCKEGYSGSGMMGECYLDGGFSAYEGTKECSEVCGVNGVAEVTRFCNNPTADPKGKPCNGTSPETIQVPCNRFACSSCTVRKTCGCGGLKPIFVEFYHEPNSTLEYFTDLKADDVQTALGFLTKWKELSQQDLCLMYSQIELTVFVTLMGDSETQVSTMKSSLVSARDIMRKKLDCNINLGKKAQYYEAYETIIKRHLAISNILKDLTIIKNSITKYMNNCDDSEIGMIRDVIGMM